MPTPTRSGHVEASSLKKQRAKAVERAGVEPFVLYILRHTCITRWAKHVDPYTLHVIAGHTDMSTTKRCLHPSEADLREAMMKVWAQSGHTGQKAILDQPQGSPAIN
jgi:integrase